MKGVRLKRESFLYIFIFIICIYIYYIYLYLLYIFIFIIFFLLFKIRNFNYYASCQRFEWEYVFAEFLIRCNLKSYYSVKSGRLVNIKGL